jgi:integrase/recombinase XerC
MVNFARRVGKCNFDLSDIPSEKVSPYRDTTGIEREAFQKMLGTLNRSTLKGKRDYAILVLLWTNALRRAELVRLNLGDLDLPSARVKIYGKGKGSQYQQVSLSAGAVAALRDWLSARAQELYAPSSADSPLFISVNDGYRQRLSVSTIYRLVRTTAEKAGIEKIISPHRIRHSSITTALDETNGNVRAVQKLSRHSNLNTLMIYDDNRQNQQKEMSDLLDSLL